MPFFSYLTDKSDMRDVILGNRKRYKHMDAYTDVVLRGPSQLTILEREILAAYVSSVNQCSYCSGVHIEVAKNHGMDPKLLGLLIADVDTAPVDDKLKPIFHYARKLTKTPSKIVKTDAQSITNAGWNEQTLEDVICITSLFNYYNRLMDGHGIKGYPGIFKEGADHLAKRGYVFPSLVAWYFKTFGWKKQD